MRLDFTSPIVLPHNRVWRTYTGGLLLDKFEGKVPEISHFPEDWIASTVHAINKGREEIEKEGISYIFDGNKKIYFDTLLEQYGVEMLGEKYIAKFGRKINILVKLLDPSIRLHLQVHPTISYAKKYLNSNNGKTEAYYIMDAKEDKIPYLLMGFKHSPSKKKWKEIILEQDINTMLSYINRVSVSRGESYIVQGGIPHALGEDMLVIEIQEPTDWVVRCEFKRGDYTLPVSARFMNMDMDKALDMFTYKTTSKEDIRKKYYIKERIIRQEGNNLEFVLIDRKQTNKFRMNKLKIEDQFLENKISTFQICIVTQGQGYIETPTKKIKIKYGDKFFVPFNTQPFLYKNDSKLSLEIIKCLPSLD